MKSGIGSAMYKGRKEEEEPTQLLLSNLLSFLFNEFISIIIYIYCELFIIWLGI